MKSNPKIHLVLMLIKWGALVVDGRGKLGGHVASQNKGGSYLRTKVTPSNPQTSYQSEVRALFGSISAAWSGLGLDAIKGWNAAVPDWASTNIFGDLKQPSGKALFQRLNNQAQVAGYSPVLAVPEKLEMVSGTVTEAVIDNTATDLYGNGLYTGADARVLIFATPPVSAGTTFVKNRLRLIHSVLADSYDGQLAYTGYVDKYGTPEAGDKVYLGFKYVLPNGQASPMQVVLASVTA